MNLFQKLFGRATSSDGSARAYTEPRSGLVFPMELGGLRRSTKGRPYGEGDRQGESLAYGGNRVEATVYVTKVGQAEFPDGGDSEFIRGELDSSMAAVREMERMGRYGPVKFFGGEPEKLGTDPRNLTWARGAFFTVSEGSPMFSFTYITGLGSMVIKLRISGPDGENKTLKDFPAALGDLVSRQRRVGGQ